MSEFSASYHMITSNQQDVADLLKRADLHGFVFPEKDGIVTFVVEQDGYSEFVCCEPLIKHNTKPLVFYVNAEDHGWSYELYDGQECVASFSSSINEDAMEGFDPALLGSLEGLLDDPELGMGGYGGFGSFLKNDYDGSFQMERVAGLLQGSPEAERKIACIQRSKEMVDVGKGQVVLRAAQDEVGEGRFSAYEFTEEFGILFCEWISYHYVELSLAENASPFTIDYGSFGEFQLLLV